MEQRRYRLFQLPHVLREKEGIQICYGYLNISPGKFDLEQKSSKYFISRKGSEKDGSARMGRIEISHEEYKFLLFAMRNDRKDKIRYALLDRDSREWNVDETTVPKRGLYRNFIIENGSVRITDSGVRLKKANGICEARYRPSIGSISEKVEIHLSELVYTFLSSDSNCEYFEKKRYTVMGDGGIERGGETLEWYVDEYLGPLSGLVLTEITITDEKIFGFLPASVAEAGGHSVSGYPWYHYRNLANSAHLTSRSALQKYSI